jgi:hypothetical protein
MINHASLLILDLINSSENAAEYPVRKHGDECSHDDALFFSTRPSARHFRKDIITMQSMSVLILSMGAAPKNREAPPFKAGSVTLKTLHTFESKAFKIVT